MTRRDAASPHLHEVLGRLPHANVVLTATARLFTLSPAAAPLNAPIDRPLTTATPHALGSLTTPPLPATPHQPADEPHLALHTSTPHPSAGPAMPTYTPLFMDRPEFPPSADDAAPPIHAPQFDDSALFAAEPHPTPTPHPTSGTTSAHTPQTVDRPESPASADDAGLFAPETLPTSTTHPVSGTTTSAHTSPSVDRPHVPASPDDAAVFVPARDVRLPRHVEDRALPITTGGADASLSSAPVWITGSATAPPAEPAPPVEIPPGVVPVSPSPGHPVPEPLVPDNLTPICPAPGHPVPDAPAPISPAPATPAPATPVPGHPRPESPVSPAPGVPTPAPVGPGLGVDDLPSADSLGAEISAELAAQAPTSAQPAPRRPETDEWRGVVLVTGTDTEVGKTIVTAAVAAAAQAAGLRVAVIKPGQTGISTGEPTDIEVITRLAAPDTTRTLAEYPDPLAPLAAATVASLPPLDLSEVVDAIRAEADKHDLVLVEGAGGLLVPMGVRPSGESWTVADLATTLGISTIVVARAGLGTLNHTALTLEALARRGVPAGVVIGAWPGDPELVHWANLGELVPHLIGALPAGAGRMDPGVFRRSAPGWLTPALYGVLDNWRVWAEEFGEGHH